MCRHWWMLEVIWQKWYLVGFQLKWMHDLLMTPMELSGRYWFLFKSVLSVSFTMEVTYVWFSNMQQIHELALMPGDLKIISWLLSLSQTMNLHSWRCFYHLVIVNPGIGCYEEYFKLCLFSGSFYSRPSSFYLTHLATCHFKFSNTHMLAMSVIGILNHFVSFYGDCRVS